MEGSLFISFSTGTIKSRTRRHTMIVGEEVVILNMKCGEHVAMIEIEARQSFQAIEGDERLGRSLLQEEQ